jgi:penicillin-binding protein 1A
VSEQGDDVDNNNARQDAAQAASPSHARIWSRLQHLSWRWPLLAVAASGILLLLAAAAYLSYLIPDTPSVEYLQQVKSAQPSIVLAADGSELGNFRRVQQEWVPLERISPYVIQALIATEDHRFYEHDGVDFGRTVAAMIHTVRGDMQGGSTITQQLARNLFPEEIGRSRSLSRKLKEIITAIKIERAYSKQQVLETYLNTVPFLYNAFGIEMAARTYFDKSAAELGPLESATLVGMLKGTNYYNPVTNPERARARRNVVLGQMAKHQKLSESDYQTLRDQPLQLRFSRQQEQASPSTHFMEHVRKWLNDWAEKNDVDLYADGLVVHTTLDPVLQSIATEAVERQTDALQNIADVEWGRKSASLLSQAPSAYAHARQKVEPFQYFWNTRPELLDAFIRESAEYRKLRESGKPDAAAFDKLKHDAAFMHRLREGKTRLEAGFVALDPFNGEVKAWVGSRDFLRDQFDHVAQAERQPGSTFKPIVYGAALEQGLSADRPYRDVAVEIRSADGGVWRPTDMTAPSGKTMRLSEGLIYSKNTITAQVMQDVGLRDIVSLARAVGVTQSKLDPVPSLALGTSPVTLLEMVTSYATIAQAGEHRQPVLVKRITDRSGKVLAEFGGASNRAMSERTAIELIDMMRGVVNRGTGTAIKSRFAISADVAGKTGTTQNNTDGWFILMHPNLVAGTWVGFNDSRVTMRSSHWGQGGHNALLVVGDFFRTALKEKLIDAKAQFPRPLRSSVQMAQKPEEVWNNNVIEYAESPAQPRPQIFVRREPDGTTSIGDAQGIQALTRRDRPTTRTPAEMARIMGGSGNGSSDSASASELRDAMPPQPAPNPARSGRILNVVPQSFR